MFNKLLYFYAITEIHDIRVSRCPDLKHLHPLGTSSNDAVLVTGFEVDACSGFYPFFLAVDV